MEKIWSVADQLVEWPVGHAHTALLDIEHRLDTRQAKVVDEQGLDPDIPRLGEPEHDDLAGRVRLEGEAVPVGPETPGMVEDRATPEPRVQRFVGRSLRFVLRCDALPCPDQVAGNEPPQPLAQGSRHHGDVDARAQADCRVGDARAKPVRRVVCRESQDPLHLTHLAVSRLSTDTVVLRSPATNTPSSWSLGPGSLAHRYTCWPSVNLSTSSFALGASSSAPSRNALPTGASLAAPAGLLG